LNPARDPRLPHAHLVVVAGHRPPELGGYDVDPAALRTKLAEILTAKRQLEPDLHVLTGLGLGAEQLGAEARAQAGVPHTALLPFPDQQSVWPRDSQARYDRLLQRAAG